MSEDWLHVFVVLLLRRRQGVCGPQWVPGQQAACGTPERRPGCAGQIRAVDNFCRESKTTFFQVTA